MDDFDWNSLPPPDDIIPPIYADDSPARRTDASNFPFNENAARAAFGDTCMDWLIGMSARVALYEEPFCGDWWMLAMLLRCAAYARQHDPQCANPHRFAAFAAVVNMSRSNGISVHLEYAPLAQARLERVLLMGANLEHANLEGARLDHALLACSNLKQACLRMAQLENANLANAHLQHADLESANLCGANISSTNADHARLESARLQRANLNSAQLQHANLWMANLEYATLLRSNLNHAALTSANLDHADLRLASLKHASFWMASLKHSDLRAANLKNAYLKSADLRRASLRRTNFDHANVRGATGILFNDTRVQRLDIEGNASDPWSVLRRTYTGPMYFLNLLLVVGFLLPYAGKVLALTTTARTTDALRRAIDSESLPPPGSEVVGEWLARFDATHTDTHALWVLLGGTKEGASFFVSTAIVIVIYNILRAILTVNIGILRDQADRVERTPTLEEYYGLCHPLADKKAGWRRILPTWIEHAGLWCKAKKEDRNGISPWSWWWNSRGLLNPLPVIGPWRLHRIASVLYWVALVSVLVHVGAWLLTTTVPVPG